MSSTALFGAPNKAPKPSYLYQFRAGKLTQDGKIVTADPRKGWAYLYVSQKSVLHFCWFDRASGIIEENFAIHPETSNFKKVTQCKDGRVYRLKTGDKRFFIYLQEPDKNDDDRICQNVKMHLNNSAKNGNDLLMGLNKLSQKDLLNILSMGVVGDLNELASDTPIRGLNSKDESGKAKSKIQLDDLRNIMSSIGGSQDNRNESRLDLSNVINVDTLKDQLSVPEVKESLKQYLPSLPADDPLMAQVTSSFSEPINHIRSAQFKSALGAFNAAMSKGGLGPLVSQFQMGSKVTEAANKGDIRKFAKALEDQMSTNDPDMEMDTS